MAIKIEDKNIFLTVRDLVPATAHQQILSSFPLPQRGALGRQAQTFLQKNKKSPLGMFHTEYVVNRSYDFSGFTFHISGRIDGVFLLKNRAEIEEIKSVILKKSAFSKVTAELYPHYIQQLLFYAYLLQDELNGIEIVPYLVMINLINHKDRTFPVSYQRARVETILQQRFTTILSEILNSQGQLNLRLKNTQKVSFFFPEKRKQQEQMIQSVESVLESRKHLIASAPTGTGKTAASLYPAVKYAFPRGKKIMFVTSKTSQQEIVKETMTMLTDQGLDLKVGFIKASKKMCANDIYFCHEAHCPYALNYRERAENSGIVSRLLEKSLISPDEVFKAARDEQLCPFEVNIDIILNCDVVVGDYNYVFDPAVQLRRLFLKTDFDDWILIIDEAHNLYERGRQYLSPQIKRKDLKLLSESIKSQKDIIFRDIKKAIAAFDTLFAQLQTEGESSFSGQQYFETDLNLTIWQDTFSLFESSYINYVIYKIRKGILLIDDPLEALYFNLRRFLQVARFKDSSFVTFFNAAEKGILNIQCCDPSLFLAQKIDSFHSVIAMSATLDPINYYREVLGFADDRTVSLQLDSPFPKEHRKIIIVPSVSTRFKNRQQGYTKIAEIIRETVKIKKGNYLAFFPSYDYMQNVNLFLGNLQTEKIMQKPSMSENERNEILTSLKSPDGSHLLLAVMGGVFSEGVDYAGSMAIGVFVISPALPQFNYERELLNRYYETKSNSGIQYAYIYPGINKVIQSAGRLIRGHMDKGVVLLIGERFAEEEFNELLPEYWFEKKGDLEITKDYKKAVREFWKSIE